ncbi:MAG: MerR family DNA-binding protein [Alphaproteobacteria bacterium]|nr:MerR family DNA-binding protein [Alphaproteobacteria bacterium]
MLSIGALAKRAATNVQTIRFYEQEGLMPRPARSEGGQRRYSRAHADRLAFIRHARELGFPLDAIRELLKLADRPEQPCARVDRVAGDVLADVEAKIARLESLRSELRRMLRQCRHGRVSECRIIRVLADHSHSQCATSDHRH